MKIRNETRWSTRDLAAILRRVARDHLDPEHARLVTVTISYQRRKHHYSGRAWVGSGGFEGRAHGAKLFVTRAEPFSGPTFAAVAAHEFAHLRGQGHRQMSPAIRYASGPGFEWAMSIPVRLRAERQPVKLDRLVAAQVAITRWERKLKLAQTKLKLWKRRARTLEASRLKRAAVTVAAQATPGNVSS